MPTIGRVGKRYTLYPPKELMESLGIKVGDKVVFLAEEGKLIVEKVIDPWDLASRENAWAETTVEEFEAESEEMQEEAASGEND